MAVHYGCHSRERERATERRRTPGRDARRRSSRVALAVVGCSHLAPWLCGCCRRRTVPPGASWDGPTGVIGQRLRCQRRSPGARCWNTRRARSSTTRRECSCREWRRCSTSPLVTPTVSCRGTHLMRCFYGTTSRQCSTATGGSGSVGLGTAERWSATFTSSLHSDNLAQCCRSA